MPIFIICEHVNPSVTFIVVYQDELLAEKEKYKQISDELDQTFAELAGM